MSKLLNGYLAQIGGSDGIKALIRITRTGSHFSNVSLSLRFEVIYLAAGFKTSGRSSRRKFATQKNALGVGMRTIQHLLGHANIATTALYCDVSGEQMLDAANMR